VACDIAESGHSRRGQERVVPTGTTTGVTHAIDIAVFPILADVVEDKTGSPSTAHWRIHFIRLNRWLRHSFAQLITLLDIDRIGQNWDDSNNEGIDYHELIPIKSCRPSMLFRNIFESRRFDRRAMTGYNRKLTRSIVVGFSILEKKRDLGKAVLLWNGLFWSVTRPLGDLWPR